jgi:hypothetical protein
MTTASDVLNLRYLNRPLLNNERFIIERFSILLAEQLQHLKEEEYFIMRRLDEIQEHKVALSR